MEQVFPTDFEPSNTSNNKQDSSNSEDQPRRFRTLRFGALDRQILGLALPALGTLMAEPLLLAADTAMVGHLGAAPLAGLSLGSTIVGTLVFVFVFLAYTTTAAASRALGQGRRAKALRMGWDGIVLAALIGLALAILVTFTAPWLVRALGGNAAIEAAGASANALNMGSVGGAQTFGAPATAGGATAAHTASRWAAPLSQTGLAAVDYLQFSAFGLVGMLVVMAAGGALRGVLDARSPLYAAVGGATLNVVLNATLIYGLDLGIRGSAIGTAIAQTLMGLFLVGVLWRASKALNLHYRPSFSGLVSTFASGVPLLIRTIALRLALLCPVLVAAAYPPPLLASYQVVNAIYTLFAYPADAFALAAQALVGKAIGESEKNTNSTDSTGAARASEEENTTAPGAAFTVPQVVHRTLAWCLGQGIVLALVLAPLTGVLGRAFTAEATVLTLVRPCLWVLCLTIPVSAFVFALDGILIGADRGKLLAVGSVSTLVCYGGMLFIVFTWLHLPATAASAAPTLWAVFTVVFLGVRGAVNARGLQQLLLTPSQNKH